MLKVEVDSYATDLTDNDRVVLNMTPFEISTFVQTDHKTMKSYVEGCFHMLDSKGRKYVKKTYRNMLKSLREQDKGWDKLDSPTGVPEVAGVLYDHGDGAFKFETKTKAEIQLEWEHFCGDLVMLQALALVLGEVEGIVLVHPDEAARINGSFIETGARKWRK